MNYTTCFRSCDFIKLAVDVEAEHPPAFRQSLNVFAESPAARQNRAHCRRPVERRCPVRDWYAYRVRFVRDAAPVRLGGVAANLARIQSACANEAHAELARNMIQDSEYLIEWTAPDAEINTASELVEMQIQLAVWRRKWQSIWNNIEQRQRVATQAGQWSARVLELSGLLDEN